VTVVTSSFTEGHVEADGVRIRYLEAGAGRPLVWVSGTGGLQLSRAHEMLAERYRLIAFEVPGFSAAAARGLGLARFNLWGTSDGASVALGLALENLEMIETLVLEAPSANVPEEKLAGLNVPTLVVFGTRDDVGAPELGRVYRAKMPNCHFVLVYDAGHAVGADRPEAFSSLVADFIDRREAFIVSQKSSLLHP